MKALILKLFLTILVVVFTESRRTECFMCYTGRELYDINKNFSLSECKYFDNRSHNNYGTCEDGCMKLKFTIVLESIGMSTVYGCQDRNFEQKIKTKTAIQNHVVCYSDFCNAESDWKIPKLEENSVSKNSNEISPVFWICLSVAIVAVVCCKMNGVCVDKHNIQSNNIIITDSSGDE